MPSSTLTPDPPTAPSQPTPPDAPTAPGHPTPPEPLVPPGHPAPPEPPASPGLRLVTVPAGWPPYDCESHGAACPVAREAATTNPHVSRHAPAPARASGPAALPPAALPPAALPPAALPPAASQATALTRQFAQVIVEILAGSRPLRQTVGWTTDRVRAQIGDLTRLVTSEQRPRIRRIVTSQPAASVVEMTVVISFGPRSRALAMRFEQMPARQPAPGRPARPARWLCTEIETG